VGSHALCNTRHIQLAITKGAHRSHPECAVTVSVESSIVEDHFVPSLYRLGWDEVPLGQFGAQAFVTLSIASVYEVFENWLRRGAEIEEPHCLEVFFYARSMERWNGNPWDVQVTAAELRAAIRAVVRTSSAQGIPCAEVLSVPLACLESLGAPALRRTLHQLHHFAYRGCVLSGGQVERDEWLGLLPESLVGAAMIDFDDSGVQGGFAVTVSPCAHGRATVRLNCRLEVRVRQEWGF
jgi:hypothetical protein